MEKFNRGNYVSINGEMKKRSWYNDTKDLVRTLSIIPLWDLRRLCKIHTFHKEEKYGYVYKLSGQPDMKVSVQHDWYGDYGVDYIQLLFFNSIEMTIEIDSDELEAIGKALNKFKSEKTFKNLYALRWKLNRFSGSVKYF